MDLFAQELSEAELLIDLPRDPRFSSCWDAEHRGFWIAIPDGELFYAPHFFSARLSDRCLAYFLENDSHAPLETAWPELSQEQLEAIAFANIRWKQDAIRMYGKSIPLPRLTSWYGDAGRAYSYSGIRSEPNPWNKGLLHIKELVQAVAGVEFNSVLLNWYRNGEDHLHWHADDEKDLGMNPTIASVNFGASRDFLIRRNDDHALKLSLPLSHGTLLLMRGAMQHHWQHCVPKRKRVLGSRINLTYRVIR